MLDTEHIGKTIEGLSLGVDSPPGHTRLTLSLSGGVSLIFYDDGQDCCEHRYMNTDDDLSQYVGARFLGAELREYKGDVGDDRHDVLECQFLAILTDRGNITVANYNEHNGYYGGFDIVCKEV
jgi:hypothetical protein